MRWLGNTLLTRAYRKDHKALIIRPEKGEQVDTLFELQDQAGQAKFAVRSDGSLALAGAVPGLSPQAFPYPSKAYPGKMVTAMVEGVNPSQGTPHCVDVLNLGAGNQGIIRRIQVVWDTLNGGVGSLQAAWAVLKLQVFVDGESTPAFEGTLGELVGLGLVQNDQAGQVYGTRRFSVRLNAWDLANAQCHAVLRWPMPYSNGVKVRLVVPDAYVVAKMQIWAYVSYQNVLPPCWNQNFRLRTTRTPAVDDTILGVVEPGLTTPATQLDGALSGGETTVTVDDTTDFLSAGTAVIEGSDEFTYTGKTGTTFTGCAGVLAHPNNAAVTQDIHAACWSDPSDPKKLIGTSSTAGFNDTTWGEVFPLPTILAGDHVVRQYRSQVVGVDSITDDNHLTTVQAIDPPMPVWAAQNPPTPDVLWKVLGGTLALPNTMTILDRPAGKRGLYVATFANVTPDSPDENWMEYNVHFHVDGEAYPSWEASSTEDYFGSGFYFGGSTHDKPIIEDENGIPCTDHSAKAFSMYCIHEDDPIPYSNGISSDWRWGAATTEAVPGVGNLWTPLAVNFLCLYYEEK